MNPRKARVHVSRPLTIPSGHSAIATVAPRRGPSRRVALMLAAGCLGAGGAAERTQIATGALAEEAMLGAIQPRITQRWGEHGTADFRSVTQDRLLIEGGNENGDYLGIRDFEDRHTLLRFDISALAPGTAIHRARLRLYWDVAYGTEGQGKSGYLMNLYRIADPAGYGMWLEDQVTTAQRRDGVPWTPSGGLFTSLSAEPVDRVFSHPRGYGQALEGQWVEWEVTAAVQGWVAGAYPNQGFLLDGRDTLGLHAVAHASEHGSVATRPYLEITYAGTGSYPDQVSAVQARHGQGQTFITWAEDVGGDLETAYRVYRHLAPITKANLDLAELIDEVPQNSATFERLEENNHRLTTPFSDGPLPPGIGLYVYTVESAGTYYYAVTRVVRGNENRHIAPPNQAGPLDEQVTAVHPVRQHLESPNPWAPGNRQVFAVWLGRFDPTGRYTDYGYANRRSVPYLFRIITPEGWDPAVRYPLLVFFHYFSDSYVGSGQNAAQPRFVLTGDDFDPLITANLYGASMWYGYNSNYGTKAPPTAGIVVNYTERRMDWILDWVMNRSGLFKVDPDPGRSQQR